MSRHHLCCCIPAIQEGFCGSRVQNAELTVTFGGKDDITSNRAKPTDDVMVFLNSEPIAGKVKVTLRNSGSKLEHRGLKAELFGLIDLSDAKSPRRFLHLDKLLCADGDLYRNTTFDFSFDLAKTTLSDSTETVAFPETYHGTKVQLRYYIDVTLMRRFNDVIITKEVSIHVPSSLPEVTRNVKTEVGVGEALHLEMECNKWKYHLEDVIYGSINFLSVQTEITSVLLQILRRETTAQEGQGQIPANTDHEVIGTHELLDGCPESGDRLPIRLFLRNYRLSPTMRNVHELFSVKYYLNLVIVDSDDNKYFKQQEIKLYRRNEERLTNAIGSLESADKEALTSRILRLKDKKTSIASKFKFSSIVKMTSHNGQLSDE